MSEVNEILKKVTASIEEATGKFNAKAEEALTEAKKNGKLSAETKETVDKMATEFNALKEAEKTLKAALGELDHQLFSGCSRPALPMLQKWFRRIRPSRTAILSSLRKSLL